MAKTRIFGLLELERRPKADKTEEGSSTRSSANFAEKRDVNTECVDVKRRPLKEGRPSSITGQTARPYGGTPRRSNVVVHPVAPATLGGDKQEQPTTQAATSSTGLLGVLTSPQVDSAPSCEEPREQSAVRETSTSPKIVVTSSGTPKSPDQLSLDVQEILFPPLKVGFDTRLVTILPGQGPIQCRSKAVALHDEPDYIALSHFWGDKADMKDIILNTRPFKIRGALYLALEELRNRNVGPVWIDNISIDQSDSRDKEQQIRKMRVIYSHASSVFAWLGPRFTRDDIYSDRRDDGEAGIEFLGSKQFDPTVLPDTSQVKAVQEVVSRPYWTRCWIIQEVCLAKNAKILCGTKSADFDTVWTNLTELMKDAKFPYVGAEVKEHLDSLATFREQESAKTRTAQMALIQALLITRLSKATEARDKIFAILRLAHDGDRLVDTPNYTQPEAIIFWKLAHNMIHLQGHVAIILLARQATTTSGKREWRPRSSMMSRNFDGQAPNRRHSRMSSGETRKVMERKQTADMLPSWVPWWAELDSPSEPLPEWIKTSIRWPNEGAAPRTSHDGKTLCIRGWLLDKIVSVSGMPGLEDYATPQPNYSSANPQQSNNTGLANAVSGPANSERTDQATMQTEQGRSPAHRHTRSRKSTANAKVFRDPRDVFYRLRTAVVALLPDKTDRNQHQCIMPKCQAKHVTGLATASVLHHQGHRNSDIRTWWGVNKKLMVGEKRLEEWVDQIVTEHVTAATVSISRASDRPGTLCGLDQEVSQLSEAFGIMQKYRMRLAVTHRCTFKLVYCESLVNDYICRLDKCTLPVVLRESGPSTWGFTQQFAEPEDMESPEELNNDDAARLQVKQLSALESEQQRPKMACRYVGEAYRIRCDWDDEESWCDQTDWKLRYFYDDAPECTDFMIS